MALAQAAGALEITPATIVGETLVALGLQFASPVVASVLVANTAIAILSRAAPQLNILSVVFPVQIGFGLFALAASIPIVAAFYRGWSGVYTTTMNHVLAAFAHGAS